MLSKVELYTRPCRFCPNLLKRVGIYLETECFGHGQLYVAASRVGNPACLRFALDPNAAGEYRTKNVVYAEALTSLICNECE